MSKLTNLKPALGVLRPSVAYMPQGERERDRLRAQTIARQLYNTSEWKALRQEIKLRDHYTCGMCGRTAGGKGQAVVDHRRPHRGDRALFFDPGNLWTLCKTCHDGAKQRQDRAIR